jgi:RNA polymerase sigma-70 factor (ECF subfamily)
VGGGTLLDAVPLERLIHLRTPRHLWVDRGQSSASTQGAQVLRELVERAKRGDEEAFEALARQVGDRCMAIASWILRDADLAEDAVQAALVRAWRELRTLRDPDRFEPWLHRILTNECYAEARRRARWSAKIRVLRVQEHDEPGGILTVNDRDQLERAFRRLTLEQRSVLVFHHVIGLPVAEIADRLGIPQATAKSRLRLATSALRASLEADDRSTTSGERLA